MVPALILSALLLGPDWPDPNPADRLAPKTAGEPSPPTSFLMALAVIVLVAYVFGRIAMRFGQPRVIGEILAGLALGPSLLGLIPGASATLFPERVTPYLDTLAQLGLVLFMFLVGAELDPKQMRGKTKLTLVLGHASIVIPGALGALLALLLHPHFAPAGIGQLPFSLFIGLAMGVTAFPVLARLLADKGMSHTPTGALAMSAAAVADVTAWCLLALVISILGNDPESSARTIGLSVLFCAVMILLVRPALRRLMAARIPDSALLVLLVGGVLISALATDLIGVHTIFGAFLFGALLEPDLPRLRAIIGKIETFCLYFLLPVFFTQLGLNFSVSDIGWDAAMWGLCAAIVGVATLGKLGGAAVTLRMCGHPWRESATIGALMNCRGLTELVVLNIGLHLGILNRTLFTLLVIMAIVTTIVTAPLVGLLQRDEPGIPLDARLPIQQP